MNKTRRDELKLWAEAFAGNSSTARRVLELLEDRAKVVRDREALAADVEEWRICVRRFLEAMDRISAGAATQENRELGAAAIKCLRALVDATDTPGMPDAYESLLHDRANFLAEQLEKTQVELADARKFAGELAERVASQSYLLSRHAEKDLRSSVPSSN